MVGETPASPHRPPNPFGVKQVFYERIQDMRLLDDALMTAVLADNIPAIELILRIILGKDDLVINNTKVQSEYKNLRGHSLFLDVDATDSDGRKYDIEIQRDSREASPERGRYHMAVMDSTNLEENHPFTDLPTSYVIFITEHDYYKKGLPIYHINRTIEETGEQYGDRAHILYVSGSYNGEDPLGLLMADFRERDPDRMHYEELAKRISALKNSEKGVKEMCQAMEITYQEGREQGLKEGREQGREQGRVEGMEQGRAEGMEQGREQGREQGDKDRGVRDVESLMETLGLTLADSLSALKVPLEMRQIYTNLIEQRRAAQG